MLATLIFATALGNVLMMETEAEVDPKDLISSSGQITTAAKNAAAGAHLIKELSKFEEAQNAKKAKNDRKEPLKRLKPAAEKVADLAKKAALASEAIATVGHTMRALDGEEGAKRAALTQGLRGAALAYGTHNKGFAPYVKTAREGVKSAVNYWANGEADPKAAVPASDAVYFSLLEQEAEVDPKDLISQSSQITTAAKNAAAGAHLIKELSKFEEAQNAKKAKNDRKEPLKNLKPAAEKIYDLAKKAALASEAIATVGHTMRALDGEEGARRAAITQGLRGGALAYGMSNKEFASIMKPVREAVTAASAVVNGDSPTLSVPASDAVYFSR